MARLVISSVASTLSVALLLSIAACSGGQIAVGKTEQQLKTKRDGTPTGDGRSCSWEDTPEVPVTSSDDPVTASGANPPDPGATPNASSPPSYTLGDDFKSPDGCNECECTARGIMCTVRACGSPPNPGGAGSGTCSAAARICKDGSLAKAGTGCSQVCPEDGADGVGCTEEAKQCPDGTTVVRSGPKCEFTPCPGANTKPTPPPVCPQDAKLCPDGKTSVGRTGPKCEFSACPK